MNKNIMIPGIVLLLLIPSTVGLTAEANQVIQNPSSNVNYYGKGYRYNIQGWVYIHIEGEPYERGYQYGYLASAEIADMITRWSNLAHNIVFMKWFIIKNLPKNYDKLSEQWWKICKSKSMNLFYKLVPEEYKQELKGIADGVKAKGEKFQGRDIEFEDIVAANFVQDSLFTIQFSKYRFHPFHGVLSFSKARKVISMLISSISPSNKNLINSQHPGHCSAFIATGEATKDGGIVVAHSTYFNPLITERCNIILDVKPSNGYRFSMACPPGSIWSQEDFYQNEKGIILTETELPQGPWKNGGTPKGVRGRRAIQYSDSIDEVINSLKNGNNGLIPNEWLIGDTKTGEIASFEQALYNTPIKRTFNGFYSSYTAPHNEKVKRELFGIAYFLPITSKTVYDFRAAGRDKKFEELEKQYYGKIDEEIAKKILAIYPICMDMTDGKITSSKLMENMGLLAFMGNPNGSTCKTTDELEKMFHGITELPPSGWLKLYPSISNPNKLHMNVDYNDVRKTGLVLWKSEINGSENLNSTSNIISENIVYSSISPGTIYALDADKGEPIWNIKIGEKIINHEVSKKFVVIGTDSGVCAIEKETGNIKWNQNVGETYSKPALVDNLVITSCSDGNIYAFDVESGKIEWNYEFPFSGIISEVNGDNICIGSDNTCYCFDVKNKNINWKFETSGKITAPPRVEGDDVYLGSWDGNIYALDLELGKLKWTFETGWGIDTRPTVSDGTVFVGSNDNNFYALDKDSGDLIWFFSCKSAIHSSPVVYGEYVFFGSDDGRLYALNKINGDLEWNYAPGFSIGNNDVNNYLTTPILSDPIVEDSIVYINAKGTIYALDAQTSELDTAKNEKKPISAFRYELLTLFICLLIISIVILLNIYKKKR